MEKNDELNKIKKIYGEEMMHLCRYLFSTILEDNGKLLEILTSLFAPTKSLALDIKNGNLEYQFQKYIYNLYNKSEQDNTAEYDPKKLLKKVGYTLYECKSEKTIQKFKRYYAPGEELCTFNGGRLNNCYVFFAVREDAEKLIRKDFINPKREDSYGTSVLSIQFPITGNAVSIKNRYNHTVNNPDATYSNNLDNIVPGHTDAFNNKYNLNINKNSECDHSFLSTTLNYVKAEDGKYYKCNSKKSGIFYCENNIIIDDGKIIDKFANEKERYILMDYFVLDLKEKKLSLYDEELYDSFCNTVNIGIKKIEVNKHDDEKIIIINLYEGTPIVITLDRNNRIIEYKNNNVLEVDNFFLVSSEYLEKIEMLNVEKIGDNFLWQNEFIKEVCLPKVFEIGSCFLEYNTSLTKIYLPNVEKIGNSFLFKNRTINSICFNNLKEIGNGFLGNNLSVERLYLPNVYEVGSYFMMNNKIIDYVYMPNVKKIGSMFLYSNENLREIDLPNVEVVLDSFLFSNEKIKSVNFEKLTQCHSYFMNSNIELESLYLPNLKYIIGDFFIAYNKKLKEIEIPMLEMVERCFLQKVKKANIISVPNLRASFIEELIHRNKNANIECINYNQIGTTKKVKNKIKSFFIYNHS